MLITPSAADPIYIPMASTLQPEMVATIVFGIFMALLALVALAQVAYYATRGTSTFPSIHLARDWRLSFAEASNPMDNAVDLEALSAQTTRNERNEDAGDSRIPSTQSTHEPDSQT